MLQELSIILPSILTTIQIVRELRELYSTRNQTQGEREESEKLFQHLIEKETFLKEKLQELEERFKYSKLAERWFSENKEQLTEESVRSALSEHYKELGDFKVDEVSFRMVIDDYLDLIYNSLRLGRPNLIDKYLQEKPAYILPLPRAVYKSALDFVKKKANKDLHSLAVDEIKFYFSYLQEKIS